MDFPLPDIGFLFSDIGSMVRKLFSVFLIVCAEDTGMRDEES